MIRIKPEPARKPVTKELRASVTKATGRPRVHASGAAKQRAYRERKKRTA